MSKPVLTSWATMFAQQPLLPVWTPTSTQLARPLAKALLQAGYQTLEITLRHAASWQVVQELRDLPLTLVVGSVRNLEQLERLQQLGINWLVSPGWDPDLAKAAKQAAVNYLPGISTPGEAMQALRLGFKQVKLFPAMALGGPNYLKALAAPLPELSFMVTGGINSTNLAAWFAVPQLQAVGGSWMLPEALLQQPDLVDWHQLAQTASHALQQARVAKSLQLAV